MASPVITTQPVSQVVCPNTGQNATFTVTATGTSLSYQWKKDGVTIAGANSASYTITGVTASDAAMYEVTVSNAAGSITSQSVYLNTIITTQPSPATQLIATGNSVTFSVSANNATGFQWKRNGTDISGATSASYTISTLTTTNGGTFTVNVINPAGGGCASLLSTAVVVNPSTTLYSKSTGALNVLSNWGVNSSGSGSRPVNFTRSEYVFKVVNQANAATGGDLTIGGTLDLVNSVTTITAGTVLSAGKIMSSGTGTLSGTTTSDLVVGNGSTLSFTAGAQVLKNFTVTGGSVSLNTDLSITAGSTPGVVTVSAGTFNTNNKLTLKSDASGTAAVGTSAGAINGEVTIERYIPAKRAWRLLTAPVTSTNAPTMNAAWQEGATASDQDPAPGYGTHITGGAASDGFDQSPTNNTSIKYFNGSGWVAIGNTTGTAVNQHSGYMFFIRGNRAYDISSTLNSTTPLSTTLKVKGNLNQGTQVAKTVAATGYTLIGNPYASGIDFSQVYSSSTNIKNRFRMWYPGLAGTNGVGGYVLVDWDGSSYTATPSVPVNSIIQSGEAFFVESNNGVSAGSLVVNESHKSNTTNNSLPFGRPAQSPDATIKMNLSIAEADGSLSVADGVLERYNDDYNDVVDGADALKFNNSGENLAIVQNNQNLVIERRRLPKVTDTLTLKVSNLVNSSYQFDISTSNFTGTGLLPLLHDAYLQQDKVLTVEGSTAYPFTVNADPVSRASNRFSIVYKNLNVLPLSFTGIRAVAEGKNSVRIEWSVENEFNSSQFYIEKLTASGDFLPIGTVAGRGGNIASYRFTDEQPNSDNVYRIKGAGKTGVIKYSDVVQVSFASLTAQSLCSVYPNPVRDQVIHVSLNTAGKSSYRYKIVTLQGQVVETGKLVAGGGVDAGIKLLTMPAAGAYQLILSNGSENYRSVVVIAEK